MKAKREESLIVIRDIEVFAEMRAAEELQMEVWGRDEIDVVPRSLMIAAREVGALMIGAFDGATLVGFAFGFVGYQNGVLAHHSHLLGVRPSHRNLDLGWKLKLAQRERVLRQGATRRMTWTFDPLQSLNAYLNIRKLGVLSDDYKINFYGEAGSSFLHRNGTDRLFVNWLLDSPRVLRHLEGRFEEGELPSDLACLTPHVAARPDDTPHSNIPLETFGDEHVLIEIPSNIDAIQRDTPELAAQWREATRRAFTGALAQGYVVTDFRRLIRGRRRIGTYILKRGSLNGFSATD